MLGGQTADRTLQAMNLAVPLHTHELEADHVPRVRCCWSRKQYQRVDPERENNASMLSVNENLENLEPILIPDILISGYPAGILIPHETERSWARPARYPFEYCTV